VLLLSALSRLNNVSPVLVALAACTLYTAYFPGIFQERPGDGYHYYDRRVGFQFRQVEDFVERTAPSIPRFIAPGFSRMQFMRKPGEGDEISWIAVEDVNAAWTGHEWDRAWFFALEPELAPREAADGQVVEVAVRGPEYLGRLFYIRRKAGGTRLLAPSLGTAPTGPTPGSTDEY
jgi:hypothetical protein